MHMYMCLDVMDMPMCLDVMNMLHEPDMPHEPDPSRMGEAASRP